jgi:hypothetical protein
MSPELRPRAGPLGSVWLFQNLILERDAFRIVFLEPNLGSDLGRKDLSLVTNLLAGVDVNPDRHCSLLRFLRPPEIGHDGLTIHPRGM